MILRGRNLNRKVLLVAFGAIAAVGFCISASTGSQESSELVARGRATYVSLCQRCHGPSGEEAEGGYPGILPLAGIGRRINDEEIVTLSAPFVGQTFEGEEARALLAYLKSLKGRKGFEDPGLLISPYLLKAKAGEVQNYRIVDVRPRAAYDSGHLPNAVHWELESESCIDRGARLSSQLSHSGISPKTVIVVYDEIGGPDAACLWWRLFQAGHARAVVLDGGWNAWTKEGYPKSTTFPPIQPGDYPAPRTERTRDAVERVTDLKTVALQDASVTGDVNIDWRSSVTENGFRPSAEISSYLQKAGLQCPGAYKMYGSERALSHLIFTLHLLGYDTFYDPQSKTLSLSGS